MAEYELNFGDYWRIIRRRKFVIILCIAIVLFFSLLLTYIQPKTYKSFATVKIEESRTVAGLLLESVVPFGNGDFLETETNVITSWPVAERAATALGYINNEKMLKEDAYEIIADLRDSITAEIIENTALVTISTIQDDPEKAADIANAIADAYIEESYKAKNTQARKVREFIESQLKIISEKLDGSEVALREFKSQGEIVGVAVRMQDTLLDLKTKLSEMKKKYTDKHPLIGSLKGQIKDLSKEIEVLPPKELEFARLQREISLNENSYAMLRAKLEDARITEAANVGNASIVDIAVPIKSPVTAPGLMTVFLGFILGSILGVVFAFVMESTDTSIGAIEDVEKFLKLSVLGVIPSVEMFKKEEKGLAASLRRMFSSKKQDVEKAEKDHSANLIVSRAPKSPIAEAYRILRTNMQFTKDKKVILFTSTVNQEGKSTVVSNLALTTAQLGTKTLLLSCDMRRPVLASTCGLKRDIGLSDVLTGAR
ncbi:MAG: GNVR domain-containing protein, partial [Candidatus Omnitrophota bacterium]